MFLYTILLQSAAVALGGALGSVLRYIISGIFNFMLGTNFPYGTLVVNVIGSCLIGLLAAIFAKYWQAPTFTNLFLTTGFLGGFTTFSAFSMEVATLYQRGDIWSAAMYAALSVALGVAAFFLGMSLAR